MTELVGDQGCIFSAEPEGNDGAGVADYGLAQEWRQLAEELVGECEIQTPFARFAQDRCKAVGGEVLKLIGIKREVTTIGFTNVGAAFGRLRKGGGEECSKEVCWPLPEPAF